MNQPNEPTLGIILVGFEFNWIDVKNDILNQKIEVFNGAI